MTLFIHAWSCSLYGFAFETQCDSASDDDFLDMLQAGVQLGKYPYSTLSVARNGLLSTSVLPETLTGPTTTDLVRPLIGAIFVLLGRSDGTYVF